LESHEQAQPYRGFRGGYRDYKHGENLAAQIMKMHAESGQTHVDGIEHDLNGNKHQDEVSAYQEAGHADAKEARAQKKVGLKGYGHY
jgi:hypothetical protein